MPTCSFLKGDYAKAIDAYQAVLALLGDPEKGSAAAALQVVTMVNLARAYGALKDTQKSDTYLAQASAIDPERVKSLGETPLGASGTRAASSARVGTSVSFVEEPG